LKLTHEFADAAARDHHIQGWRFQLSLFVNAVADQVTAGAPSLVDGWLAAWSIPDDGARRDAFAAVASAGVRFGDRYSAIEGLDELVAHTGAAQRFMPQMRLERRGEIRQCQGMVLAEWAAVGGDGRERGSGTNVFAVGPDGRIQSATGFWNAAAKTTA
jgi:hypothetical protein